MLKLLKLLFKTFIALLTVLVLTAVFADDEDKPTTPTVAAATPVKPVDTSVKFYCDATTKYSEGYYEFTVDGDKLISMTAYEDNYDPMTFSNPSKNWTYLGNGKFKHELHDDAKECSTTNTFTTTDVRSQYMYASQESLIAYTKKRVKQVAGTNQVKYHSILGVSYRTFPDWGASKETLKGRVRFAMHFTITNVFGGKELYTAVIFADGADIEEFTIRDGHI